MGTSICEHCTNEVSYFYFMLKIGLKKFVLNECLPSYINLSTGWVRESSPPRSLSSPPKDFENCVRNQTLFSI